MRLSPRTPRSPRSARVGNALFVKVKHDGKVAGVLEVDTMVGYEELLQRCAERLEGKRVSTLHYLDGDGELILIRGEDELRLLVDQNLTSNFSVVANLRKKKGSKKQGSRRLKKAQSSLGGV